VRRLEAEPMRDGFPAQAVLLLASTRGGLENASRAETLDEARTLISKALEQIEFLSRLAASAAEDSEGALITAPNKDPAHTRCTRPPASMR
jgi:hypothetical protein